MGLLNAGKVCLFSEISGVITLNGEPAAGAELTRTANLNKDKVDYTTTDDSGHFKMPAVFQRTVTQFLPQEFVAKQEIYVSYQGTQYRMWSGVKRKPEENVESRGEPLVVHCELRLEEENYKRIDGSPIFSLCTWNAEPDPPFEQPIFDTGEQ
ncbi:DUF6795 domain-containing protein [Marinimicrobium sp. ARAG 43.8]|uniref:DUF6795 domain-containing protein n=1 Tax=Marinimicrobium sp. ARAG 43.8 TaxID=3418719 RepID=UPI003CF0B77B